MPSVLAYHRPTSLDEASELLAGSRRWALAGGTIVVPEARQSRAEGIEVVDLQALGLDHVESGDDRLRLGAMVRLGEMVADDRIPDLIREAARRELPSALRNQATIGGTVAQAESESLVVAALLVHDAQLEFHSAGGSTSMSLGEYLAGDSQGLIVGISVATSGQGVIVGTGRTPADVPIVAAVSRASDGGTRLALTGVAATPVEVSPDSPTVDLDPPGDFRGSSEYRVHLATVLSQRALTAAQSGKSQ